MKKQFLSRLMVLALCLMLLPTAALAAAEAERGGGTHAHYLCGGTECTGVGGHTEGGGQTVFGKKLTSDHNVLQVDGTGLDKTTVDGRAYYALPAGSYYLDGDVALEHTILIPENTAVNLCLNGHSITSNDLHAILVGSQGILTLSDCKGGRSEDGKISQVSGGYSVELRSKAAFSMYGGSISGNRGGGVNADADTTFSMYGGTVSGNGGRGVQVSGTFNMYGGSISGNRGGGVHVEAPYKNYQGGTFTVSGAVTVTGNTVSGAASNVYLPSGKTITIGTDGFAAGAQIGVTTGSKPTGSGTVPVAAGAAAGTNYSTIITSDDSKYQITYDITDASKLVLTAPVEEHTHCICGAEHRNIGSHKEATQTVFGTKLWMDGGTLKKGNEDWTKGTVKRADGGTDSSKGYVLTEGAYYLDTDLTLTGAAILIDGDVRLCLNGKTIDRANGNAALDYVIWVLGKNNAHLTLTDCKGGGKLTGGKYGGVDVFGSCTLDMFGGIITGNEYNGGVNVGQNGTFNMYGGKITGNSADYGGGVYNGGTVNMYGGEITGNSAKNYGGGVYMEASMGNYQGGILNVSGAAKITGNTVNNKPNNVYLPKANSTLIGVTGALTGEIGVTPKEWPKSMTVIASGVKAATGGAHYDMTKEDTACFRSDNSDYEISLQSNNVVLAKKPDPKEDPTITAPTARSGLVYNGQPQELISAGSTTGGTMQYKLGDGTYDTALPTAQNAGTYTVWYKVVGDDAYNDVAERSITVSMDKAKLSGTPAFTKVTAAGKTLKDVTLTKADGWPDGKFEWGNGVLGEDETAPLVQGKEYSWLYIADNHYAAGTVVPWPAGGSTPSGGGGSPVGSGVIRVETRTNPDGSVTTTETWADGTVTETTTGKDGGTTRTTTRMDGSSVTESSSANGTTGTVRTDVNGRTEAAVRVSGKAVEDAKKSGEAVRVPIEVEAGENSSSAPTVKVELPGNAGETEIEIPVSGVNSGTVAVIVHPDGTEEIVKNSKPTEVGVQLTVNGNTTIRIIDNSKDFIDTRSHWSRDEVNFVASRELFIGVGDNLFGVNQPTTRGMVNTVLARLAGVDTTPKAGQKWYEVGTEWAKSKGITDGTDPEANVTREQLAALLYRFYGSPAVSGTLSFADAGAVSGYAQNAILWAAQNGIMNGVGNGRIAPNADAQRAQVAAMMARCLKNVG